VRAVVAASVTVSVRGPQARQAVVDLAQAWRGLGWLGQVRPGIAEGHVEAPSLVLDYLEGRHTDAHRLIDQWSVDVDRIVGAASALADMLIGTSREMFGRADEWLAALHFSLTGQGRPPGPVPVSDPVENLERELHTLGLAARPREDGAPRHGELADVVAGSQMIASFLAYREAEAFRSEGAVRAWLGKNPTRLDGS
jgi:hypothetical protein